MARNSSIDRLPAAIREKIGQLRQAGKTIDEILEKLKELDVDVSRSALGRHCKQLEEVSKSIRQSRIVAEALAKNFGDEGENKVSQVNIELMHSLILKMMVNNDGETITMDSKDAFFMACKNWFKLQNKTLKTSSSSAKNLPRKPRRLLIRPARKKAFRQKTLISSNARFSGLSKNGRVSAGQSFFILSTAFKHNGFDLTSYRR